MRIFSDPVQIIFPVGLSLALILVLTACTPPIVSTPALPEVVIQAMLTQDAQQAADAIPLHQTIPPSPSPTAAPFRSVSIYQPTQTLTLTPELTRTRSQAAIQLATSTPYQVPTQTPLPAEHYIIMSGHHQFFNIGCETGAAVDWAQYYGLQIGQYEFQYKLPRSDNPDFGFVGNVNDPWGQTPPYSYGVYPGPVAAILNAYGIPASAIKNGSLDMVKHQLASDNPIIVWVIGNMVGGIPASYTDKEGRTTIVAAYEHVVILTGYNENTQHIRYLNNGRFFEIPYNNFLNSWKVLNSMAIIRN